VKVRKKALAIILGIDPGSRITGFGVILQEGSRYRCLQHGSIRVADYPIPQRLACIFQQITAVVTDYQPDQAAIEQIFMHENAASALKLGQARGVAIASLAIQDLAPKEYSARQVKKAVAGYGAAGKEQVQLMIKRLLNLDEVPQEDAADALAVALCHAFMGQGLARLQGQAQKIRHGRLR
jgi:crossover junction endodeoxyribonuclease RuvC